MLIKMKLLEEYNDHDNDTPKQRNRFLNLLKFRHKDSVVSLKDVKVVLKAPYEVLTD